MLCNRLLCNRLLTAATAALSTLILRGGRGKVIDLRRVLPVYPKPLKQMLIMIDRRVARSQQLLTIKQRVGAGHETHRLHFVVHFLATGREPNVLGWHQDPRDRDGADEVERVDVLKLGQRRARNFDQVVDWDAFGSGIEIGQRRQQSDTVGL